MRLPILWLFLIAVLLGKIQAAFFELRRRPPGPWCARHSTPAAPPSVRPAFHHDRPDQGPTLRGTLVIVITSRGSLNERSGSGRLRCVGHSYGFF
jgi:hypothetical protein